ncbi:rhodanese-like domain-containing protein [Sulfitobacter sp. M57]|uniref:rhodanese-like domain-containing protein n=1 Tax=unclassified Sulfitobacter TaxID=196795 RepID=UPI0023E30E79|nr:MULTISPECIES: rhodanese-like domain-containing protein [unclassified Sulfitobacter]MDF3415755.1 rhodanese-like domain-containing protein [Sulfitobacter sp. KE5]MDF3423235.1 rhodanese-like domain-containing protein [Sulfitobacter sp. KE43]MDF3434301.1 rhodanese-like domain-containing protein [Sulfitobacter sp. KE42]MDF3459666.1 rhodanese-like domain-containing protein [Sulfitobacter sp. S74]MDF3463839.1 rhodanese-like domain-containing protein [Sulfitobacter sp. Ks18]
MTTAGKPLPDGSTPSRFSRRGFLLAGVGAIGLAGVAGARWFNLGASVQRGDLTAPAALAAAATGEVLLIDIRRPEEWARSGIGQGAVPIDMRRKDFINALLGHSGGRKDIPVALICARGVRSARMAARLEAAGFTRVLDVPEGMSGSGAGPGWLKRGLPVVQPH